MGYQADPAGVLSFSTDWESTAFLPNGYAVIPASIGITARQRTLVTERLSLPNPSLPLVVVDVDGRSRSFSPRQSHSNDEEANCTVDLVQALLDKNIPASSIAIITFYKDQQRMLERSATRFGVRLHTVDSVQGHEMDIVIILTTRTNIDRSSGDFLDDLRRLNEAEQYKRRGDEACGIGRQLEDGPAGHRRRTHSPHGPPPPSGPEVIYSVNIRSV
ncbi:hypothetical protein COOONC_04139 [Cooperia oncophora]